LRKSQATRQQRKYDQAEVYIQKGLALAQQLGLPQIVLNALYEYGNLRLDQQQIEVAEGKFREMLRTTPDGRQDLLALAHYGLARTAAAQNNLDEARRLGEGSVTSLEKMGHYKAQEVRDWLRTI